MFKSLISSVAAVVAASSAYGAVSLQAVRTQPHVPGQALVTFGPDVTPEEQEAIVHAQGGTILRRFHSSPSVLISISQEETQFLARTKMLSSTSGVRRVGLNRLFKLFETPNDPKLNQQYQHKKIDSFSAWDVNTGSKDVLVAVIDTGIDYTHPDLAPNMWRNPGESGKDAQGRDKSKNGVDDDQNGYVDDLYGWDFADNDNDPMDTHGHGTHCAGSIGAAGNNNEGVAGINWNVSLVGLRFIGNNGQGEEADAVAAIEYASAMGIHITSNSWGGDPENTEEEDVLQAAIAEAGQKGMLFVAAAGNDGRNTDSRPTLPASYSLPNIISVAASNKNDGMTGFSNFGVKTVDLMAPGDGVFSTSKMGLFGGRYKAMSGTSMACPLVAGAAALVKATFPDASMEEIRDRLLRSVDPVERYKDKLSTGGRLNVYKAISQ